MMFVCQVHVLLIFICNIHVLSNLLLNYIFKLHSGSGKTLAYVLPIIQVTITYPDSHNLTRMFVHLYIPDDISGLGSARGRRLRHMKIYI